MSEYSVKDYGNIANTKVYGLDESIVRAKYPMSVDTSILNSDITKGILALSNCEKGTGHDQWLMTDFGAQVFNIGHLDPSSHLFGQF